MMDTLILFVLGVAVVYLVQRVRTIEWAVNREKWALRHKLERFVNREQVYAMILEPVNSHGRTMALDVTEQLGRGLRRRHGATTPEGEAGAPDGETGAPEGKAGAPDGETGAPEAGGD